MSPAWADAAIVMGGLLAIAAAVLLLLLIEDLRRERPPRRPVICADCKQVHHTPYPAASRVEPDRE